MRLLSAILILSLSYIGDGSKILGIFPMPSKSHYILGQALFHGLANRGHDVTLISPFQVGKPIKNYKEIVMNGLQEARDEQAKNWFLQNATFWDKFEFMFEKFPELFHIMHNNSNVQEFRNKKEKFDLCIVSTIMAESLLGICNEVQATPIGFSIVGLNSMITYHTNNPVPYSYVPSGLLTLPDKMSFMERFKNVFAWIAFDGFLKFVCIPYQSRLLKQYYPEAPEMAELLDNIDLYLMNSHISTDAPKPLLPNIIPIGGFHLQIMEDIPKDIKTYLDNSKKGVIYFNMGSNFKSSDFDPHVIDAIIKTFAKLDYDILWKFETDLPNKPKNVRIEKWLPQRPILMHPNVKIFMTHGGLGGTVEAIYGAVPMICMPMFADQGKNCADSVNHGYAILLEATTITEENLLAAIKKMLENPSYKEKILFKSDLYKNQEVNPMDKAIFWIEHVIRHKGAKHLKSQAANIPWYQYYLLDVISFLGVILVTVLALAYFIIKVNLKVLCWVVRKVRGTACDSKVDQKKQKKQKVKKN